MMKRVILVLSLVLFGLAGCQGRAVRTDAPRGDQGGMYVYIRPMPEAAMRLRIVLGSVAAVKTEGELVPLELRVREIDGLAAGSQRLLAVGRVPPGSYRGLALSIEGAWLRGEEGEGALLVPKEPIFVAVPLTVGKEGAALAEVVYHAEGPVTREIRLDSGFSAYVPGKPVFSRVGYAASFGGNHLAVFDRSTLEVVSVIGVGRGPSAISVDEGERRAYVALSEEDAVEVVDIPAGQVVARIRLRAGDRPESLAFAPNRILLCTNRGSNTLSFIDVRSAVEIERIEVGDEPEYVLMDRQSRRAYIFNSRSHSISVVDVGRRAVVGSIATEAGPFRGAFNRASDRLYVIHRDSPYMMVVDANSLEKLGRILVGMGTSTVYVDRDTNLIYLGKRDSAVVDIYDPFSLLPIDFLEVPDGPSDMVIDREGNRLLLALPRNGLVSAIDLATKRIRAVMDVGGGPLSLGIMGERR